MVLFRNELFRNIDFGIFDQNFNLLLLIELNDNTHAQNNRKARDIKVKELLNSCQIKLLTFYTSYANESNYVVERVLKVIENKSKEEITNDN